MPEKILIQGRSLSTLQTMAGLGGAEEVSVGLHPGNQTAAEIHFPTHGWVGDAVLVLMAEADGTGLRWQTTSLVNSAGSGGPALEPITQSLAEVATRILVVLITPDWRVSMAETHSVDQIGLVGDWKYSIPHGRGTGIQSFGLSAKAQFTFGGKLVEPSKEFESSANGFGLGMTGQVLLFPGLAGPGLLITCLPAQPGEITKCYSRLLQP